MKNRHLNRLVNFSERDDLTGLLNKRGFKLRTRFYVTNPKRVFSYVYIDMNNLKKINDQLGHNVGNTYLEIVGLAATELSRKYSESDIKFTFARTGGDEFEMLISCPRERGHDYDRVTKTIISELYSIAKELWKGQKTRVVKEYGIDAPDMAFASGYSVAAIPCSVAITDVRDYEKLTTKDIDHIDKYLDSLRSTAETEMYKHADMKGGNGRI
jgi:diguanylate cyclase (GGDEF)-like protein